jgi:hypothetical protein
MSPWWKISSTRWWRSAPGLALDGVPVRVETPEEVPAAGLAGAVEEVAGKVSRRAIAKVRSGWSQPLQAVAG